MGNVCKWPWGREQGYLWASPLSPTLPEPEEAINWQCLPCPPGTMWHPWTTTPRIPCSAAATSDSASEFTVGSDLALRVWLRVAHPNTPFVHSSFSSSVPACPAKQPAGVVHFSSSCPLILYPHSHTRVVHSSSEFSPLLPLISQPVFTAIHSFTRSSTHFLPYLL